MEKYYLDISNLYIEVDKKLFNDIVNKISKDYRVATKKIDGFNSTNFTIYYAVDDEIPFFEPEEIGYIKYNEED